MMDSIIISAQIGGTENSGVQRKDLFAGLRDFMPGNHVG